MKTQRPVTFGVLGVTVPIAAALLLMLLLEDEPRIVKPPLDDAPTEDTPQPGVVEGGGVAAPSAADSGPTAVLPAVPDASAPKSPAEISNIDGEDTLSDSQIAPSVAEVRRIVAQCSADFAGRYKQPLHVTLSFELRADGEQAVLSRSVVEKSSVQDPHFEACVQDAPLDVRVELRAVGGAKVRVRYP